MAPGVEMASIAKEKNIFIHENDCVIMTSYSLNLISACKMTKLPAIY